MTGGKLSRIGCTGVIAIILSVGALYFVLRRVNLIFQILPMHPSGVEGGLIEIAVDTICGGGLAMLAIILAFVHFIRQRLRADSWGGAASYYLG